MCRRSGSSSLRHPQTKPAHIVFRSMSIQRVALAPMVDACHPSGSASRNPASHAQSDRPPRTEAGLQPGEYTVRLTVDGQTLTQAVTVEPDPRGIPEGGTSTAFSPNANSQ